MSPKLPTQKETSEYEQDCKAKEQGFSSAQLLHRIRQYELKYKVKKCEK